MLLKPDIRKCVMQDNDGPVRIVGGRLRGHQLRIIY